MENEEKSSFMKVDLNFRKTMDKFIEEFYTKHKIVLKYPQATRVLNEKIRKQGGLKI